MPRPTKEAVALAASASAAALGDSKTGKAALDALAAVAPSLAALATLDLSVRGLSADGPQQQSRQRAAVITRTSWGALPLEVVGLITDALGPHALPLVSRELRLLCDQLPTLSICGPLSVAAAAAVTAILCRGSRMCHVRQLRLTKCAVTGEVLAMGVRMAPQLTHLYLYDNSIDDAGARAVAEALRHVPQLTHLVLSCNSISDAGKAAVRAAAPRTCTSLSM